MLEHNSHHMSSQNLSTYNRSEMQNEPTLKILIVHWYYKRTPLHNEIKHSETVGKSVM